MLKNKQIPLIYLLLTAAVVMAFWRVNQCGFINFDDGQYVTENTHIANGVTIEAIRWAFTAAGYAYNWHPITWMSHMLDVQLFGLNPHPHHLVNLLFHVLNTLLLFFVFNRMTKAPWKSAFVAALFGLHPLHVESVAWVAERKDVLSTFFWMLAMAAYIQYVEHGGLEARSREQEAGRKKLRAQGREGGEERTEAGKFLSLFSSVRFPSSVFSYMAVLVFFVLGLMSKPMLVTLPFVLLLMDYWPLGRLEGAGSAEREGVKAVAGSGEREPLPANKKKGKFGKKRDPGLSPGQTPRSVKLEGKSADRGFQWALIRPLLLEKIPLFFLAALSCIVTYAAQQKGGSVVSLAGDPLGVRIANALISYLIYIEKTIWPDKLAVFYPHPGALPLWQVLGAVPLLMATTLTVIRSAKRFPYMTSGWLWFMGTLVPVIGIVQVGKQAMADRYAYIPLIGLFIMAAWGVPELLKKWQLTRFPSPRKEALFALPVFVLACFSIVTWTQVGYWRDSISLCDHALKVTSRNDVIHYNRALAYHGLGDLKRAISDYDRAIEINPRYVKAYIDRGIAYRRLGNYRQAIESYDRAIEINPKLSLAFNSRGFAYAALGDYGQAIKDYSRAIELEPGYVKTYYNRSVAYHELGRETEAIEDLKIAARFDSEEARDFLTNRGISW
jgi:hypothetical protein